MISRNACYWIWITLSIGYNNPKVKRISEMYSDVSAFYYGGISEWRLCGIFSQKDLERFSSTGLDDAKKIVDRCIECNYSILCIDDELFPKCLYNIECPPALIYINGVMPDIDNTFSIGIVGTRRATKYGIENSYRFAYALSKYGTIIVSGGALGVDGASHRGALATDGITICVRGCGLNCSYLRENSDIRSTIPKRGAVITEYPPDETPRNYYFPARNRIIAALSDGLLVMEAGKKSGSLITAILPQNKAKQFLLCSEITALRMKVQTLSSKKVLQYPLPILWTFSASLTACMQPLMMNLILTIFLLLIRAIFLLKV